MSNPVILAIDDDRIMREIISQSLGSEEYELLFAENGLEGLKLFHERQPEVILLDLVMPIMDGFQFLKEIKANSKSNFEVIVFTNHDTADRISLCYDLGVQMLLRKPLISSEVKNVVSRSVRLQRIQKEKIEAQKKAEEHQQKLVQADKMASLGVLVTGVAHEINNPNNFIMMNSPILLKAWHSIEPILEKQFETQGDFQVAGIPYSEMRAYIPSLFEGIKDGAERIKNIVEGLKDYARQEAKMANDIVYINDVVKRTMTLISNMINKSTNFFELSYGKSIPPFMGSAQKIEQVLINIIQNACQALAKPENKLTISTRFDEQTEKIIIAITDEGIGIPEKNIPYIMDPFFTTKRKIGGTGLGLAISMGIVQDHNGELVVESRETKGTKVTISLPTYNWSCRFKNNQGTR